MRHRIDPPRVPDLKARYMKFCAGCPLNDFVYTHGPRLFELRCVPPRSGNRNTPDAFVAPSVPRSTNIDAGSVDSTTPRTRTNGTTSTWDRMPARIAPVSVLTLLRAAERIRSVVRDTARTIGEPGALSIWLIPFMSSRMFTAIAQPHLPRPEPRQTRVPPPRYPWGCPSPESAAKPHHKLLAARSDQAAPD